MRVKLLLPIVVLLMLLPFTVFAKDSCKIVSGNGKDIGSEIACGTEHFYIIENKNDTLKLLSKYNLYVGYNFNKIQLDINKIYSKVECSNEDCSARSYNDTYFFEGEQISGYDEWRTKIQEKYHINSLIYFTFPLSPSDKTNALYNEVFGDVYSENGKNYRNITYKLYPYETILENTEGYALQNKKALGVTGEKGNANYPINATLSLFPSLWEEERENTKDYDNFENGYTNFDFNDDYFVKEYLNAYKEKLNDMGYSTSNVDMINMKEINDLVYSTSKKNLPLSSWYNTSQNSEEIWDDYNELPKFKLGDLKEYLSDEYSWLWDTSYWTKTFASNSSEINDPDGEALLVYFVSTSGEICYSLSECGGIPRAGIRPVVTIAKDIIKYNIYTKTDGNGTIEVVNNAFGGESISFRVSAKKGLKLSGLTITTDSGEKVEFREEDLTTNNDGTISISTNKFTMPFDNVTIEARWTSASIISNPKTGDVILSITFIVFFSIVTGTCINKVLNKNNA